MKWDNSNRAFMRLRNKVIALETERDTLEVQIKDRDKTIAEKDHAWRLAESAARLRLLMLKQLLDKDEIPSRWLEMLTLYVDHALKGETLGPSVWVDKDTGKIEFSSSRFPSHVP